MENDLIIRDEIDNAIETQLDPVEMATVILPRIERAIELAETPIEINELRDQIETVSTYLKRSLPKAVRERIEQFKYTHESDMLFLKASSKAGVLWDVFEDKRPQGMNESSGNFPKTVSATEAGFRNSKDATVCVRIGTELDGEDWRVYEEETKKHMRQPTLGGIYRVWQMQYLSQDFDELPDDKYRVIYADPPWRYGNTMPDRADYYYSDQEQYYPLKTPKELAALDIKDIALDDAVLFLWATSPILEEAFEVIKAWGFKYKSSFVWDKVKHNMGHYNSVRHEFLLVCTRGSCQPDTLKLYDSVQTIERGEHSEKPEEFREIIDTIYPNGNRIELFARKEVEGWDAYGNEI